MEEHKTAMRPAASTTSPVHGTRRASARAKAEQQQQLADEHTTMAAGLAGVRPAAGTRAPVHLLSPTSAMGGVIDLRNDEDQLSAMQGDEVPLSMLRTQPHAMDDPMLLGLAPPIGLLNSHRAGSPDSEEDSLNEVEDAPKYDLIGEDEDDEEINVNAVPADIDMGLSDHLDVEQAAASGSESEYEVNDDPHCYCRLPWDGDEKMIECEACRVWFHFDCMGIPVSRVFEENEKWRCDSCLAVAGLPVNKFPLKRRNRRKELAKLTEKSARRARVRLEKKQGLTKEERAAVRSKERLTRRKERTATNVRQEKEATAGGLKSLLAAFDDDGSSSSSSSDSSDEEDSPPPTPLKQVRKIAPGSAVTPLKKVAPSPSNGASTPKQLAPPMSANRKMASLFEPIRAKVRATLMSVVGDQLCVDIEASLFQHHQTAGKAYLAQCRDIMANLKDPKNDLKKRVMSGMVTPAALASMTSNDLASSEMSQEREQIRKDAVKDSVRAVSPPRDKSMLQGDKSLLSADDRPVSDAILNHAISGLNSRDESPPTPTTKRPTMARPTSGPKISAAAAAAASSELLASLPKLGSFEDAVQSYQAAGQARQKEAAAALKAPSPKNATTPGPDSVEARRAKRRELQARNAAVLAAANAALASQAKKAVAETIQDSDDDQYDPDAPPKPESVVEKKRPGAKGTSAADEADELQYQQLGLPPMDVWNGDLLLSAGANPSVLTNYFPLLARQVAGPPVLTLPLASRIEESLRLKLDEVQKYVQLVVARGSKRVVVVEFALNTSQSSGAATSTLQEDYSAFCANYVKKNRALAFDYQKDPEITNRLLLYVIPPDTGTHLSAEFVKRTLKVARPQGKMWGIFILPRETFLPIAKRISRIALQKMQAQAAAVEKYNALHAPPVAAPTPVAKPPSDPRRAAAASAVVEPSPPSVAEPVAAAALAAPAAAVAAAPADAVGGDLAALLKSNPASLDYFSSLLSRLVDKTGAATAATTAAPAAAPVPVAAAPTGVTPIVFPPPAVASFPPPAPVAPVVYAPPAPSVPQMLPRQPQFSFPPAPQPMHPLPPPPQQHPQGFFPPPQQHAMPLPPPDAHMHASMLGKRPREDGLAPPDASAARRSRFGPDKALGPPPMGPPMPQMAPPQMAPPQQQMPPQRPTVGTCDFFFSARGCKKSTNCPYSHDPNLPGAQAVMRLKGIPPHLQGIVNLGGPPHQQHPPQQQHQMPPPSMQHQQQHPPPQQQHFMPPPQQMAPPPQQMQGPPQHHPMPPPQQHHPQQFQPHMAPPQQQQQGPQFAPPPQGQFPPPQQQFAPPPQQQGQFPPPQQHGPPPPHMQHPGQPPVRLGGVGGPPPPFMPPMQQHAPQMPQQHPPPHMQQQQMRPPQLPPHQQHPHPQQHPPAGHFPPPAGMHPQQSPPQFRPPMQQGPPHMAGPPQMFAPPPQQQQHSHMPPPHGQFPSPQPPQQQFPLPTNQICYL